MTDYKIEKHLAFGYLHQYQPESPRLQSSGALEHALTFTFLDGSWIEVNQPIVGLRTLASWLGSSVVGGVRAFETETPDLHTLCTAQSLNKGKR